MPGHADHPAFVPAMGTDGMLPLYDLVARLAGAHAMYRAVVEATDLQAGMRVLDVGCGTGSLAMAVGRRHREVEVIGLDPDERVLVRARRKAARARLAVRFEQGYVQELPHPDASFDRVLSSLMFHHLGRGAKASMLAEVRRVLVPGGYLVLADVDGPVGMHGLLARRRKAVPQRVGGFDAIVDLITAAGLVDAAEIGRVGTRMGPIGLFRAFAP